MHLACFILTNQAKVYSKESQGMEYRTQLEFFMRLSQIFLGLKLTRVYVLGLAAYGEDSKSPKDRGLHPD